MPVKKQKKLSETKKAKKKFPEKKSSSALTKQERLATRQNSDVKRQSARKPQQIDPAQIVH